MSKQAWLTESGEVILLPPGKLVNVIEPETAPIETGDLRSEAYQLKLEGWSTAAIARKFGKSRRTIRRWLEGAHCITVTPESVQSKHEILSSFKQEGDV